jgi:hypothetical protein
MIYKIHLNAIDAGFFNVESTPILGSQCPITVFHVLINGHPFIPILASKAFAPA